jgi:hypothetical protein
MYDPKPKMGEKVADIEEEEAKGDRKHIHDVYNRKM